MRKADAEKVDTINKLREWIKPGDTVYTVLDSVSRSGMSRQIRVLVPYLRTEVEYAPGRWREDADGELEHADDCAQRVISAAECTCYVANGARRQTIDFLHPNHSVAIALGMRRAKRGDGLVVGGCGMDMGFHLVYELSHALYGEGYACLGKGKCPSNYHVNYRRILSCHGGEDAAGEHQPCFRGEDGLFRLRTGVGEAFGVGEVCPTCKGKGQYPNPAGPERFDLVHTDGYALRHKWL